MKCFSIMQPWAWLIVNGHKDIENRDWKPWNPGLKFRGRVLIHAGLKLDTVPARDVLAGFHPVIGERLAIEPPAAFDCGGIVGAATIAGVVTQSDSPWFVGPFGFVIRDARPLPFIPCKGALGFFDAPADAVAAIRQLAGGGDDET